MFANSGSSGRLAACGASLPGRCERAGGALTSAGAASTASTATVPRSWPSFYLKNKPGQTGETLQWKGKTCGDCADWTRAWASQSPVRIPPSLEPAETARWPAPQWKRNKPEDPVTSFSMFPCRRSLRVQGRNFSNALLILRCGARFYFWLLTVQDGWQDQILQLFFFLSGAQDQAMMTACISST